MCLSGPSRQEEMLEFPHLYGWGFLSSLGEKVLDTAAPRVHYGHHDTSKGRGRRGHVRRTTRGDGCRLWRCRRHHLHRARHDGGQVAGAQAMSRLATCPHVYVCPKCGQTVGIHAPVVVCRPVCTAHTRATGGPQVMVEVVADAAHGVAV